MSAQQNGFNQHNVLSGYFCKLDGEESFPKKGFLLYLAAVRISIRLLLSKNFVKL